MKKTYADMTAAELQAEKAELEKRYNDFKAKNLKLDMSRGKPGSDQLDLSNELNAVSDYTENGVDLRNYGMMDGTPACKNWGEGDGGVRRVVAGIRKDTVLTLEPHLAVFEGYAQIDRTQLKNKYAYSSSEEAFSAAAAALRGILRENSFAEGNGIWKK